MSTVPLLQLIMQTESSRGLQRYGIILLSKQKSERKRWKTERASGGTPLLVSRYRNRNFVIATAHATVCNEEKDYFVLKRSVSRWMKRMLSKGMNKWKEYTRALFLKSIILRLMFAKMKKCMDQWRYNVMLKRKEWAGSLVRKYLAKFMHLAFWRAFNKWKSAIAGMKVLDVLRLSLTMWQRHLRKAWIKWVVKVRTMRLMTRMFNIISRFWVRTLMLAALNRWKASLSPRTRLSRSRNASLGHCDCVYGKRHLKYCCTPDKHLANRVLMLREELNRASLADQKAIYLMGSVKEALRGPRNRHSMSRW